jgi:hypothetical protein
MCEATILPSRSISTLDTDRPGLDSAAHSSRNVSLTEFGWSSAHSGFRLRRSGVCRGLNFASALSTSLRIASGREGSSS